MKSVIAAIIGLCVVALLYWAVSERALRNHHKADQKGAEIVHDTARDITDNIDAADPDSLLSDTNGLRDD